MYYFLIDLFTCYRLNIFIDSCALVQIFLVVLCFPLSMYLNPDVCHVSLCVVDVTCWCYQMSNQVFDYFGYFMDIQ